MTYDITMAKAEKHLVLAEVDLDNRWIERASVHGTLALAYLKQAEHTGRVVVSHKINVPDMNEVGSKLRTLAAQAATGEESNTQARLDAIAGILEGVDQRAMAADGNVTPGSKEITDAELRRIYLLATTTDAEEVTKVGCGVDPNNTRTF